MKYEFNKKRHLHLLDGKALTGCTTILSVVAKPALIQWAANEAIKYVGVNLKIEKDGEMWRINPDNFTDVLEEARTAHCKRKEKAGEWGTKTHEKISELIENAIRISGGEIKDFVKSEEKPIQNFIDWAVENKVKFLETEKNIYSERLWIGGIVDFVCEIDGKVWIGDIKTSGSGIYVEHFWQCAGYDLMLKDMGLYPEVAGYLILNLKESGEILEKRSISNGDNTKAFLACLEIYRVKEKIKNQVI